MAIKQVGLSWVGVKDSVKARKFFIDILGLKVFEEHAEYGWLEVQGNQGGQVLGVGRSSSESGMQAGVNAVVTFVVDEYDQTKKDLASKGIEFFNEIAGFPDVPRMICFKDPDGNMYQLVEETPHHTDKV